MKLEISILANGLQVHAYLINAETLAKLRHNAEKDYPEDALEIIRDNCIDTLHISNGIDLDSEYLKIKLSCGKNVLKRDSVINVYEGFEFKDFFKSEKEFLGNLLCFDEDITELGVDKNGNYIKIPSDLYVIVETVEYKNGDLCGFLDIEDGAIDIKDFRITAVDLDVGSDYSAISYGVGLVDNLERDIVGVSYKGTLCELGLNFSGMSNLLLYLVARNEENNWEISSESYYLLQAM